MGRFGRRPSTKFVPTPKKCQKCCKSLKNPKYYVLLKPVDFESGFWTIEKKCKRCGYKNVAKHNP